MDDDDVDDVDDDDDSDTVVMMMIHKKVDKLSSPESNRQAIINLAQIVNVHAYLVVLKSNKKYADVVSKPERS